MSIEVRAVTKRFREVTALDNVTLTFEPGKIYGLLGRNGAGKSTLLSLITNRKFPDEGEILVDGQPVQENDQALQQLYLMSEQNYYPEGRTLRKLFFWSQEFYPQFDLQEAERLAEAFELDTNKKFGGLSTGYASIFKIIVALSCGAPYVLLDEPVLGLDANHRDLFYRLLLESYERQPRTFVLSTHLIEEAAGLIEEVAILKQGKLIIRQPTETLLASSHAISGPAALVDAYTADLETLGTESLAGYKTAYLLATAPLPPLPEGLESRRMDLQKLFIQLTDR